MFIGSASVELHIPQSGSLKNKRQVLQALKTKLHNKFNISVAEVEHNDLWQRATLGIAVVTNQSKFAEQVLSQVVEHIHKEYGVEVINYSSEIL